MIEAGKFVKSGLWMPQLENKNIIERFILTLIYVMSRRTFEGFSVMVLGNVIKQIGEKYSFYRYIELKSSQYSEDVDVVDIKSDINNIDSGEIGKSIIELVEKTTEAMEKHAGYFFIREIKEDLPYDYEQTIRDLNVDLDMMQLDYITRRRKLLRLHVQNADIIKYILKVLFDILEREEGRGFAFSTLDELVKRFSTKFDILRFVMINDIRNVRDVEIVTVKSDINDVEPSEVGSVIQKMIQEINKSMKDKSGQLFIDILKDHLSADYIFKLEEIGVNLHVIQSPQELVVKHVLKALIDVLSQASAQSYAILTIDNVLKEIDDKYEYLKFVKIDSTRYSEGIEAVNVPSSIASVRPSEVGKALRNLIEKVILSLGEEAAHQFVEKFRGRLGKAYLLRIEEMGVNLHMIELKQSLLW